MVPINEYKTLDIKLDKVNSYIPPIVVNEADNNGRHLKFTPTYESQPITGITSARMYYDPRPRDAASIGDYVDGTKDGDGWVFIIPPNTFTANVQGIASVSFTDEDGETYTRSMPIYVESGGTKADSQGTRIDRLIAVLEQMVNDFTLTAEAETGEAGSQANVTVNRMNGGAYNLKFVIPRGDKGDTGDAATIQLGKVTTGNPGTNAEVTNSGTENNAIFNFTIPRGDAGPAGVNENVPLGSTSGVVAQASDAYPALPRKLQVHGRTIENLFAVYNSSADSGNLNFSTDSSGLITVTGTASQNIFFAKEINVTPNSKVWLYTDSDFKSMGIKSVYIQGFGSTLFCDVNQVRSATLSDKSTIECVININQGSTVNAKFRIMLVASETEPDANLFVPSGVHTVKPTKLAAAGKNFLSYPAVDDSQFDGALTFKNEANGPVKIHVDMATNFQGHFYTNLNIPIPAGTYTISYGDNVVKGLQMGVTFSDGGKFEIGAWESISKKTSTFAEPKTITQFYFQMHNDEKMGDFTAYPMLELGSTKSDWEACETVETELPSDISLADGDTLAIDRDGTTQIVHSEGEPTVLDNVTLPELPAPTFNVYTTGGYVPPTVEVDYERDVNLVLQALEAKIAALQVADKTN